MYLGRMTCKIKLADKFIFHGANNIEIKKSVHQPVQTAKVLLPLSAILTNVERQKQQAKRINITDVLKEGDKINIAFGYDNNNRGEFTGYIKRINEKHPLELECEDELYLLRKVVMKKSFKSGTIRQVIQYVLDETFKKFGVRFKLYDKIPELTVTNFIIDDVNGIAVFGDLADKYFTHCYLTNINGEQVLYAGLLYGLRKEAVKYLLGWNTINADQLKYQTFGDVNFKCTIINDRPDGSKKKVIFGDKNGKETEGLRVGGYMTDAELKHFGDAKLSEAKAAGYRGSFLTFTTPYCEPGYIAKISDKLYPQRGGDYLIGTVLTTFGTGGGRRKIEIDILV